jgi:hypothetical protein
MRYSLLVPALLAVSACGSERDSSQVAYSPTEASDSDQGAPAPPEVSTTVAPGVAFIYRYAFQLAPNRIAAAQDAHAAACEKLGIARCRITGMSYRSDDPDDVEAMLSFKLDPAIARLFGQQSAAWVTAADGQLLNNEISGTDVGSDIAAANRAIGSLSEDLRKTEALLDTKGLSPRERARLQTQVQNLRQSLRSSEDSRADHVDSLASTPMTFEYRSGYAGSPIRTALNSSVSNVADAASVMAVLGVMLAPWLAIAGVAVWLFRRFRRKAAPPIGSAEA